MITCQITGEALANQMPRVVIPLSNFRSRTHPSRQILASRPDQLTLPGVSIEPLLPSPPKKRLGSTSNVLLESIHNGPRRHDRATTARLEHPSSHHQHCWPRPAAAARLCDASRSSSRQLPNEQACAVDMGQGEHPGPHGKVFPYDGDGEGHVRSA